MSRALLRGFVTAVAILVLVQQSISLLGLNEIAVEAGLTPDSTTIQRLLFVFSHFNQYHQLTSAFSITALFILIVAPFIKNKFTFYKSVASRIPEVLVVVIASIVICRFFHFDQHGLDILGKVGDQSSNFNLPLPFPSVPKLPEHADIKAIIVNAAIITIIGFVESIAAAKTFARKHTYFVSANRELVALGIANIFGGMFQSFPAFGSVSKRGGDIMAYNGRSHIIVQGAQSITFFFFLT